MGELECMEPFGEVVGVKGTKLACQYQFRYLFAMIGGTGIAASGSKA